MARMPRVATIFAIVLVAMLLTVPVSPAVEDAEAIAPIIVAGLIVSGIAISFIAGWLANDYLTEDDGPVYDQEKLASELREQEAEWITSSIEDASIIVGNAMDMNTESWRFTNSYWERQAEVAVADQWTINSSMNAERILEASGLRSNSTVVQYNWALLSDAVPNKFSQVLASYQEVNTYGSMRLGLIWDENSLVTDGNLSIHFGSATIVSSSNDDCVYLDNRSMVYVLGGSARIESELGSYVLVAGENNISAIPSGVYELQADRMYIGGLASVFAPDAADINAGLIAVTSAGIAGAVKQDSNYAVWSGSNRFNSESLSYGVRHEVNSWKTANLNVSLCGYQNLLNEIEANNIRAINAAQVMWMVFDSAGNSTSMLSPSAIIPALENLNLTVEQQYLIYMSVMQQIGDWYSRNSINMELSDLSVSPQSLELVCRGAIYGPRGQEIVGADSVWTPMIYLRDQPVSVGNSTWTQTGLVMVWGTTSSLDGWESNGTAMRLIEVTPGYSFSIEEMTYQGNSTDLVNLEVSSYTEWAQIDLTPIPDPIIPPESISVTMIIGICALLVAMAFLSGHRKGKSGKVETMVILKDERMKAAEMQHVKVQKRKARK